MTAPARVSNDVLATAVSILSEIMRREGDTAAADVMDEASRRLRDLNRDIATVLPLIQASIGMASQSSERGRTLRAAVARLEEEAKG